MNAGLNSRYGLTHDFASKLQKRRYATAKIGPRFSAQASRPGKPGRPFLKQEAQHQRIDDRLHRRALVGEDDVDRQQPVPDWQRPFPTPRAARDQRRIEAARLWCRFSPDVGRTVATRIVFKAPGTSIACTVGNTSSSVAVIASTRRRSLRRTTDVHGHDPIIRQLYPHFLRRIHGSSCARVCRALCRRRW